MTLRTFIFCDICNPQGVRSIEQRRSRKELDRNGRRICDGRSWVEGGLSEAKNNGWIAKPNGQHICPICQKN